MANQAINSTTQEFLDIYDVSNNILLLKDGSTSMIISINAMNFGLLAEQEQDAIIYTYAALLNSLNYPIQIVIQSQTKDASNYLDLLIEQEQTASPRKKQHIARYRQFVANLIRERNVLDKKFYVVVSASALEMGLLPPQSVLPGSKQTDISTVDKSIIIDRARTILEPRRDHIAGQFSRIGLIAKQLSTQEIIRVFYTNYNPEAVEGQQITDTANYTTPIIKASTMGGYVNTQPNQQPVQQDNTVQNAPAQPQPMQPNATQPIPMQQQPEQPVTTQPEANPNIQQQPVSPISEPITAMQIDQEPDNTLNTQSPPPMQESQAQQAIEDSLKQISEQPVEPVMQTPTVTNPVVATDPAAAVAPPAIPEIPTSTNQATITETPQQSTAPVKEDGSLPPLPEI